MYDLMSETSLKTALEMHAKADEAAFERIDGRFDHLDTKLDALLIAVTEVKSAHAEAGKKSGVASGLISSGVLVAAFEAFKQVFMK